MLKKYKKIIDKAKTEKIETLTAWYTLLGMREDPFVSNITPNNINCFVDREDVVDSVIFDIGASSRGIPVTLFIVAPLGSGKSSILTFIHYILEKLKEDNPEKYSFKGQIISGAQIFEKSETNEVQPWIKIGKENFNYLLIDDAQPGQIRTIMKTFTKTYCKVFVTSPIIYDDIYSTLTITPKNYFLEQFHSVFAFDMLNKRVTWALMDEKRKFNILDLFENEALSLMHKFCMGNPFLILKCASESFRLLHSIYKSSEKLDARTKLKVSKEIIEKVCKLIKCYQASKEFENISRTKMDVIRKIIYRGKTPTELSNELEKDRTTISRHLNDLKNLGLVEFKSRGRESVYQATKAFKIKFEIENMPKGGIHITTT